MPQKRRKHVPLRTCIACQQKRPKRELLRVVRRPEGNLEVDPTGKLPGRGAYLCPTYECWGMILDGRRLARALKCPVSAEDVETLRASIEPLAVEKAEQKE